MSKLNDYLITEGRGKHIKENEALTWIQKNCQKFIKWMGDGTRQSGRFISRSVGRKADHNYWMVEPKKSKELRRSANTFNYYTLIMDEESKWSKFPKRSKSLICLTDGYDHGRNEWIIFPKDGEKIGNTNERDFWGVADRIDNRMSTMDDWVRMIDRLLNFDKPGEEGNIRYDKTLSQFKSRCKEFDEQVKDLSVDEQYNYIYDILGSYWSYNDNRDAIADHYKGDLYKMCLSQIDPSKLGVTLHRIGDNLPKETEIWTDSSCIMINSNRWHSPVHRTREKILGL